MTVDDLLANPIEGLNLPPGAFPVHAVLIVEYAEPGSDNCPGRLRLAFNSDEDAAPWTVLGMLRFAMQLELDAVIHDDDG